MSTDFVKFTQPVSLRMLLEHVSEQLQESNVYFGHGTDNAGDEAIQLVLYGLGLPAECDASELDKLASEADLKNVYELLERRITFRLPAAYLTGKAWFADLEFYSDPRALVPRSPLAELVERGFAPWHDPAQVSRVLDLCCGGGCIGIASAHYLPAARVSLADVSLDALELAKKNIDRYQSLSDRLELCHSDLFQAIAADSSSSEPGFDIIVSNPPYVDAADFASMPAEYHAEPALGLEAGEDGLNLVRLILKQAAAYLNDAGLLFIEVGNSAAALKQAFPHVPFTWLEFSRGGDGVFLLRKKELEQHFPV